MFKKGVIVLSRVFCRHRPALIAGVLWGILLVSAVANHAWAAPSINFKGGGLDKFRFHGRVALVPPTLGGPIDPVVDGFGVTLSNEFGVIYEGWLLPGDLTYIGDLRYRFKDKVAREGAGTRDGLFYIFSRFRQYAGVWYYTVRILAYSDLSFATEPRMTLEFHQVGTPAALTVDWVRQTNGWRLPLSRF
jgi:hypothetical protein